MTSLWSSTQTAVNTGYGAFDAKTPIKVEPVTNAPTNPYFTSRNPIRETDYHNMFVYGQNTLKTLGNNKKDAFAAATRGYRNPFITREFRTTTLGKF